jgi:hypothetical protein
MAEESPGFSLKRVGRLLGWLLGIPVLVVLAVMAYRNISGHFARETARNLAEAAQVNPGHQAPPADALTPKDDFYRIMQGGIQPNFYQASEGDRLREGGALHDAFSRYVKRSDVMARTEGTINKGRWSFDLFAGGFNGPYWNETVDWCIRLRMPPGDEKMYAYTLAQLSGLVDSESIGLENLPTDLEFTPETALDHISIENKKELLIPIRTYWNGVSAKEVEIREWHISPESGVCLNITHR